ncbi:MAG: hypothetical protein RR228_02970 [Bacilli bacterium]
MLNKNELLAVEGGFSYTMAFAIGGFLSFLVGFFEGYLKHVWSPYYGD